MSDANMSESIGELAAALALAQGEITGALKDSKNPFFKSSYADLASCWDACRGPLSKHGLSVIQTTAEAPEGVKVLTTLAHKSGQWIRGELFMKPTKNDPQGIGSCLTYARRYALAAIVGLAQIDDDANSASGKGESHEPQGRLEGPVLTPEKRDAYLPEIVKYIAAGDSVGLRQLWDELSQQEQADLWKLINSKQKEAARALLQQKKEAA